MEVCVNRLTGVMHILSRRPALMKTKRLRIERYDPSLPRRKSAPPSRRRPSDAVMIGPALVGALLPDGSGLSSSEARESVKRVDRPETIGVPSPARAINVASRSARPDVSGRRGTVRLS